MHHLLTYLYSLYLQYSIANKLYHFMNSVAY